MNLKEQLKLVEMLRNECDGMKLRMDEQQLELINKLKDERNRHKEQLAEKDKDFERFVEDLNGNSAKREADLNTEIDRLKKLLNEVQSRMDESKRESQVLVRSSAQSSDDSDVTSLKQENNALTRRLNELKIAYDELSDEKSQLLLSLSDLKRKKAATSDSSSDEAAQLNFIIKVSFDSNYNLVVCRITWWMVDTSSYLN